MITGELIEMFVKYRRSIGESFNVNASRLRRFVNQVGYNTDILSINVEVCENFLKGKKGRLGKSVMTSSWVSYYSTLKGFFAWAVYRGYISKIPLPSEKPKWEGFTTPYIFSKEELCRLFGTALSYQKVKRSIPPKCMQFILRLTYFLGLRISETVSLKLDNVYLAESYVVIEESKFHKSRMVPFNEQVGTAIRDFLEWRDSLLQTTGNKNEQHLFIDYKGQPVNISTVRGNYDRIRKKAGIHRNDGAPFQPRLHDLRHSFAVHRLTEWYRKNCNVQEMLNILSTYLGHDNISNTSVYLTMTDELLEEASLRFENYKNGQD